MNCPECGKEFDAGYRLSVHFGLLHDGDLPDHIDTSGETMPELHGRGHHNLPEFVRQKIRDENGL